MRPAGNEDRASVPETRQITGDSMEMVTLAVHHRQAKHSHGEGALSMRKHQRILGGALVYSVSPLLMSNGIFDGGRRDGCAFVVPLLIRTREAGPCEINLAGTQHDVPANPRLED